jgi:hypothetical protein
MEEWKDEVFRLSIFFVFLIIILLYFISYDIIHEKSFFCNPHPLYNSNIFWLLTKDNIRNMSHNYWKCIVLKLG